MSRCGSLTIVDNHNYQQSQIAYILENDNISMCKPFSKHTHPSLPTKPKAYQAMANTKYEATNS